MPTPVSALIHAATMVTAGIYLLMRTSPLIEYSSTVLILCLWVGAITTVFSSVVGLFQQDIKKVIAYSTMSQLARVYLKVNRHQTICVEVIYKKIINSQITKAHGINHNNINFYNSSLTYFIISLWQYFYTLKSIIMSERWKIIIISKLVGISEAIRLVLIFFKLINKISLNQISNKNSDYTSIIHHNNNLSINNNSFINNNNQINKQLAFNQWLGGLIDGDGYFILTKKGYSSCEITMDIRDKKALYEIKQKYGGSIKTISNANALRYKLRHKKGLISLINDVNGQLRNPTRLLQINKLCIKYKIQLKYPEVLTFNNGWFSGFIDSDGSIYYNQASGQVFIGISQKNKYLLEPLIKLYGGRVDIVSPKVEAFKYIVYRKLELFKLIDEYFIKYPLKTEKKNRLKLTKEFFNLRVYKQSKDINQLNKWIEFKNKWDKYKD